MRNRPQFAAAHRPDYRRLRIAMVRDQLESRGIQSQRILDAMRDVPRHLFIQEAMSFHAYEDAALPIGHGQTISQPYTVAKMTELLQTEPGMRVLEIGSGCGYQAAVLARAGCIVYGIERIREIYQDATLRMRWLGESRVHLRCGDGSLGLPPAAPFERILVSAGAPSIPSPLVRQLGEGGILLVPVGERQRQRLLRIQRRNGKIYSEDVGGATFVDLVGSHGWQTATSPGS